MNAIRQQISDKGFEKIFNIFLLLESASCFPSYTLINFFQPLLDLIGLIVLNFSNISKITDLIITFFSEVELFESKKITKPKIYLKKKTEIRHKKKILRAKFTAQMPLI